MNLAISFALMAGSVAAFSTPSFGRIGSNLKMSASPSPTYTYAKSEEIFAEAKTVSGFSLLP